jgi:hypothetical protein
MRLKALAEDVRSEVLTAATVKNKTFWALTPYLPKFRRNALLAAWIFLVSSSA